MKNIDEFIEAVKKMRKAQNEYFRTRSGIALNEAKKLEKQVDEMLPQDISPIKNQEQPKLF